MAIGILSSGLLGEVVSPAKVITVGAGGQEAEAEFGTAKALQIIAGGKVSETPVAGGIALVNTTTANGIGAAYSIALPSGTGGLLILYLGEDNDGGAGPTGWTLLFNSGSFGSDGQDMRAYYRVADGSEASPITGAAEAHEHGWSAVCQRWSGVDSITPVNALSGTASAGNKPSPITLIAPTITTTAANCMLLYVGSLDMATDNAVTGYTAPTGFSNKSEGGVNGVASIVVASKMQAAAGATGTATGTATTTATARGWCAELIALKPS
jgi:hypothetical protein